MEPKTDAKIQRDKLWSLEELGWYRDIEEFQTDHWWLKKVEGASRFELNEQHSALQNRVRKGGANNFRNAPIFWEVLRRHPDVPHLVGVFQEVIDQLQDDHDAFVGPATRERLLLASQYYRPIPAAAIELAISHRRSWNDLPDMSQCGFESSFHLLYTSEPFSTGRYSVKSPHISFDLFTPQELESLDIGKIGVRAQLLTHSEKPGMAERPDWLPERYPWSEFGMMLMELETAVEGLGLKLSLLAYDPAAGKENLWNQLTQHFDVQAPSRKGTFSVKLDRLGLVADLDDEKPRESLRDYRNLFQGTRFSDSVVASYYIQPGYDAGEDDRRLMEMLTPPRASLPPKEGGSGLRE